MRMESEVGTLIWTVTYRADAKNPQQVVHKYTEEAAITFARGIQDLGGVAIVTEDYESSPIDDDVSNLTSQNRSKLEW